MVSEGEVCRVDKTFSIKDYHDEETFRSKEGEERDKIFKNFNHQRLQ